MLLDAISLEGKGSETEAAERYQKTAVFLRQRQAFSEAAFSLYYASDLAQARGDPGASLALLDQAWSLLSPARPQPYLEAILLQGKGYTLWYLDQLQPSIQAFQQSLERYEQLGLNEGIAATWNNLAILHEELHLPDRARLNYQKALSLDQHDFSEAVAFQLNANMAFFLSRLGDPGEFAPYLERARQLGHQDPFEFALLECRVRRETRCAELQALRPKQPARQIERLLALGRDESDLAKARDYYRQAHQLALSIWSPFWERKATLELGELLEAEGHFDEAAQLYREGWEKERDQFQQQAIYYPFSRAIAPLFSGRVRSLVESGRSGQAWVEIQDFAQRRQARIGGIGAFSLNPTARGTEQDLGLQAATRGNRKSPRSESRGKPDPHPGTTPGHQTATPDFPSPDGFTILELWSEGSDLFIWVFAQDRRAFHRCSMPQSIARLVDNAVGPFYAAEHLLPSLVSLTVLRPLYDRCFRPLEPWLEQGRILVIPHNEIQSLPLELLPDKTGLLADRIAFSYLPRWSKPPRKTPFSDPPRLLLPGAVQGSDAQWLRSLYPGMLVISRLPATGGPPTRLPWLHISTHFRLLPEDWMASSMEGKRRISVEELIEANFHSRLLTLGMCDGGKNVMGTNPYWLGLAEILLERRTDSLLLSRWKLDEFSLGVYQRVYEHLRAGLPVDLALFQARRDFLKRLLVRTGSLQSADHPFLWAGISYLGHPDVKFGATRKSDLPILKLLVATLPILFILLWRQLGKRARK